MPTYVYRCEAHDHLYEETRAMADDPQRTSCPKPDCGSPLKRVWHAAPITFKGSGFYSSRG